MPDRQTRPYRTDWQSMDTCCLDISLHNKYQEGLYLASAYKWVSKRFKFCMIYLGDTLHRHNLSLLYPSQEQGHNAARKMGDDWISNNAPYLSWLTIPHKFIRSDDWLSDPEFEPVHEALWSFYYEDAAFRTVINTDVETFVERRKDLPPSFVRNASLKYLLEETATDILLGKRGGVAHLYPGHRHQCYGHLVQRAETLPALLKGLENSAFKRVSPKVAVQSNDLHFPESRSAANS